jgi:periplasmic divalent cation tolerance protein
MVTRDATPGVATTAWLCHVNVGSREEALRIGRAVVEERLAACANVIEGLSSLYWWHGRLEEASEALLTLKTRAELVPTLIARVRQLHSYDCPGVVALPIAAANADYLDWIARETLWPTAPGTDITPG